MPDIGQDFRTFLLADASINAQTGGARVHQNHAPEEYGGSYVWYGRSGHDHARTIDQAKGETPFEQYWDVEAIGKNLDDIQSLALAIAAQDSHRGAFGAGTVQAVFVVDHNDDYLPRGLMPDFEDLELAAFQFRIFGYAPGA